MTSTQPVAPAQLRATRPPVVYGLPASHGRYGAERMALATLHGLAGTFRPILVAAPGRVHEDAARLGIESAPVAGNFGFARWFAGELRRSKRLALLSSGVEYSLIASALNLGFRRRLAHAHVAHGGPEPAAYRRKKLLNRLNVEIIAVSHYARERMVAYGTRRDKIRVIGNFLDEERVHLLHAVRTAPPQEIRRVVVISQIEPIKRIDLVFDAIDRRPELRNLQIRILGDGPLLNEMRERATGYPNVELPGFSADVEGELGAADLLLHCCPVEAAPIAVLEGMAAGLPVLAPDAGGAAAMVEPGHSGWHFQSDDPDALGRQLCEIVSLPPERLVEVANDAQRRAAEQYGQALRCADYRALIEELLG